MSKHVDAEYKGRGLPLAPWLRSLWLASEELKQIGGILVDIDDSPVVSSPADSASMKTENSEEREAASPTNNVALVDENEATNACDDLGTNNVTLKLRTPESNELKQIKNMCKLIRETCARLGVCTVDVWAQNPKKHSQGEGNKLCVSSTQVTKKGKKKRVRTLAEIELDKYNEQLLHDPDLEIPLQYTKVRC